jgi:hypothetical protein
MISVSTVRLTTAPCSAQGDMVTNQTLPEGLKKSTRKYTGGHSTGCTRIITGDKSQCWDFLKAVQPQM